ncbi:hypothetical protein C1645_819370 [Glomus cerebriforme]|uniref:F-box domain-containing protein n=1 Tax=Glomus cerebriforme TaxID=658196 RepID=A0A397T542_9GLOM|nr:hypothetical protein C1645_819370 [Glomus cerebriforme]
MTSPYLPDDCIYYILKYLQIHRSTLFNCLLVNRFWCKATVPLLYANPYDSKTNKNIISTLISCFNKVEILQLKSQLNFININNININNEYKPLFEYLKYLETFNYDKINFVIIKWFESHLNLSYIQRNNIFENIIPIFHQSILHQSINIKQLNISLYLFYNKNYKNYNVQTFTSNLTKLNSLTLLLQDINLTNNEIVQEILNNITNICLNLKKLEITSTFRHDTSINNNTKEKLYTIIQNQNNLKVFKISHCEYLLNNILLSLEFQKYSLVYIEFKFINFCNISFKNFINLCNLKYLKFVNCKGMISSDQYEILNHASFDLRELIFIRNTWCDNCTPLLIKYLGASLKELILVENLKVPIIENISIYCLNLITLEIEIDYYVELLVFPYFKNLKIRVLDIIIYSYHDMDELIANNLPISIKEISIRFHNFHSLYFKKFLENCHNCLEIINLNHFIELEFLKIILNYIERSNNSLKFLGITNLEKVLNDEESNLLDQIKAKGVKIVNFYNSYKYDFII